MTTFDLPDHSIRLAETVKFIKLTIRIFLKVTRIRLIIIFCHLRLTNILDFTGLLKTNLILRKKDEESNTSLCILSYYCRMNDLFNQFVIIHLIVRGNSFSSHDI